MLRCALMVRLLAMLVAVAMVTWLSLAPARTFARAPAVLVHLDWGGHFLGYGLLVALGRWALVPHWSFRMTFFPLVLGAAAYGLAMELAQSLLGGQGRVCDLGDVIANSLGALCFWLLTGWLTRTRPAAPG